MNRKQKITACRSFFDALTRILQGTYEVVASCNQDLSQYLVPNGTASEITYHSKPTLSFRISDHWNWYANLNKCKDPHYIQCYTRDMPRTKKRLDEGKASKPIYGVTVCVMGNDGLYHAVYGEKFDRKNQRWDWLETDPADIAEMVVT